MQAEPESLIERLHKGDKSAAEELVDRYYRQIYLFIMRMGNDRQTSEDLTQEVFLTVWQKIGQLKYENALRSWIYRIAVNASKLHWRKAKKKTDNTHPGYINGADEGSAPSDDAAQSEEIERAREALTELPLKLREVIVLHYLQNMPISEASDVIGIKEGTFKSRLNRALNILRKQLL